MVHSCQCFFVVVVFLTCAQMPMRDTAHRSCVGTIKRVPQCSSEACGCGLSWCINSAEELAGDRFFSGRACCLNTLQLVARTCIKNK